MNQIIQRLSEVETAASSIIEEAGAKKKQMAKDQDARIAAFEKQVHEETQKKISAQQAELEKQIADLLLCLFMNLLFKGCNSGILVFGHLLLLCTCLLNN